MKRLMILLCPRNAIFWGPVYGSGGMTKQLLDAGFTRKTL
jgi:hypothetical protein